MVASVTAHGEFEAIDYIKRYVSSFNNWTWEIKPLKKGDVE